MTDDKKTVPSPYHTLTAPVNGKLETAATIPSGATVYIVPSNEHGEVIWHQHEHCEHKILEVQLRILELKRAMRQDSFRFWFRVIALYLVVFAILVIYFRS